MGFLLFGNPWCMSIKHWPENERPREKMLNHGIEVLTDAELLAIFFRTGIKGRTAIDIARDLLSHFRGLKNLMAASPSELSKQPGIGLAKYAQLKALSEMSKRLYQDVVIKKDAIHHVSDTKRYVKAQLQHFQQEVFACLFLDTRNQIICFEKLFYGTLNSATVYPRSIAKRALYHNAASVIFAHNHPSGNPEPSEADKIMTKRLTETLDLLEIRVLDHLIVGEREVISFAEENLI